MGKAVNLKNRVRSYFHTRNHTPKVAAMVEKVDDFDILLCETNLEALMLECNLIKLHEPYYNILLRDDKQYPYIRIDDREDFPRVELVRRMEKDGAKYFGPYIGATAVRDVLEVLRKNFPLRTCKQIPSVPRRACVHHEIGQCMAPCTGTVSRERYHAAVRDVIAFLSGKTEPVLRNIRAQMEEAAANLDFEHAALLRDRIRDIEGLMERQYASSTKGKNQDIVGLAQDGLDAMAEVLHIRNGKILGGEHFTLERAGQDLAGEVLAEFILQFYEDGQRIPAEILCQDLPEEAEELEKVLKSRRDADVRLAVPHRGEKRALVLMAQKNACDALEKRNAHASKTYERTVGAAEELAKALGLSKTPRRIEAFDISNTQGTLSVASMVVFIDGEPVKKEYRHYRIKTVEGPNDFASMAEVIGRRFRRGLAEKKECCLKNEIPLSGFADMPDLILIDGGPEQLIYALNAMHEVGGSIPMFGLAERFEEIWLPNAERPLILDRRSSALHLIQRLRDEAHRFAITHHRALRGKSAVHSRLEDIAGIGPKRRATLLKHYKTLEALKEADEDEIAKLEGMTTVSAHAVYLALHKDMKGKEKELSQ